MRLLLPIVLLAAAPAAAFQAPAPTAVADPNISQLVVYGDDPCPPSSDDTIVVCARKPETERYRIPENLRGDPNDPANDTWTERASELQYVGRQGIGSCSPVGPGGFTGCWNEMMRQSREDRRTNPEGQPVP